MTLNSTSSTSEEGLLAGLSHLFGFLVSLVIWAAHKDRSPFVRFQSMQAMAFDLFTGIVSFLVVSCFLVFILSGLALAVTDIAVFGGQNNPTAEAARTFVASLTAAPFMILCVVIPLSAFFFALRVVAAIQTFQGRDFHYPWLGRAVEGWIQRF